MWSDYLKLALDNLTSRKLRSWLTMMGVFIGIMAVVTLISLGQGLQHYIDRQFEKVGGDRISITPGGGGFSSGASGSSLVTAKLDDSDLDVIEKTRGVEMAVGMISSPALVEYNKKTRSLVINGIPTDSKYLKFFEDTQIQDVEAGSPLKKGDGYKALIGAGLGEDRFGRPIRVGDRILIKGVEFTVAGIREDTGSPVSNRLVIIPQEAAKELFEKEDYEAVIVKVQKGFIPQRLLSGWKNACGITET